MNIQNNLLFILAFSVFTMSFNQNTSDRNINLEKTVDLLQVFNDSTILNATLSKLQDSIKIEQDYRFKNEMAEKNVFQFFIKDINSYSIKGNYITIGAKKNTVASRFYDYNLLVKKEKLSKVQLFTNESAKELTRLEDVLTGIITPYQKITFKTKTWQETITYIEQHKDALLDFHYYTEEMMQTVVLTDSILLVKVIDDKMKYIHKVDLKKLKQVKDYKGEGLLLTVGWENVDFTTYNKSTNTITEESKSMHFALRIHNIAIKKNLQNAFKRIVVLNTKK
jgi:hypothetical protein